MNDFAALLNQHYLLFLTDFSQTFCGYYPPNDISFELQPGESATILFTSDSSFQYNGFIMNVIQVLSLYFQSPPNEGR